MNLKLIDPKIVASRVALLVALGAIVALLWWGDNAVKHAQQIQDPVQKVINSQGLLDN